ncbi:MAG: PKD domain-containing protein [Candidatus Microbacterium phytovorans]|uniref:PKD domain-containing protein n=1 Tax=Candidatus Microbacterium phytovorans TaxID=3121374 RepID=A0AAJ5VYV1_9MICO|nr:PKD domain-containing protein [Microbacterium sp.]WEK12911.1 MAG: PKD domain-containing protein [Microbacterium sp.]
MTDSVAHPSGGFPAVRRLLAAAIAGAFLFTAGTAIGGPPSQAAEPSVSFSAAGDYGMNVNGDAVLRGMRASGNDLTLALGDMLGAGGVTGTEQTFCDYVVERVGAGYPFELIAGNHDNGSNGNINDFSACLPNQLPGLVGTYGRQYYVDYPQDDPLVRFVMVSPNMAFNGASAWFYGAGSARYNWTAAAIDGARAAGIPWVVAGMHYQCLSVGMYACPMGADLADLFVAKRVDLVLTGHEHLYQRTKQLAHGAGCTRLTVGGYEAACVVDADTSLTKGAGTVFLTVGLGGVQNRTVDQADAEAPYFAALSGQNLNSSYGFLSATLTETTMTAHFENAVGPFTDAFTIGDGAAVPNTAPVARADVTCTALTCAYDGRASSDVDGTVTSYAWTFGDGDAATGDRGSHTYAEPGIYTVSLTVTDDDGATHATNRTVTVAAPGTATVRAADAFDRTLSGSWGQADVGGAWSSHSALSVAGGSGTISSAVGAVPSTTLTAVSAADVDLRTSFVLDKIPVGGSTGTTVSTFIRRTADGRYWAKIRVAPGGAVYLTLSRVTAGGAQTSIASETRITGLTLTAGTPLNLRFTASGAAPTQLSARVWTGATEPSTWQRTATDATAGLQGAGSLGFEVYTSTSVTNGPVRVSIPDLRVIDSTP